MSINRYVHISTAKKEFYFSDHEKAQEGFPYSNCFFSPASDETDLTRASHERGLLIDCGFTEIPDPGKIWIHLTYFKPSGKYYSHGAFAVDVPDKQDPNGTDSWYKIMEEIQGMVEHGNLPNLVPGTTGFHVYVSGNGHPGGYPHIFKKR